MSTRSRPLDHSKYKRTISNLLEIYDEDKRREDSNPESQAHNAKYLAVLVSGYLEHAITELMLGYAAKDSKAEILRYVEKTWPSSRNMKTTAIMEILDQFNSSWSEKFTEWLKEDENRKNNINSIVKWRNSIAHGEEANTTGVTLNSVRSKFDTASELILFIDNMITE